MDTLLEETALQGVAGEGACFPQVFPSNFAVSTLKFKLAEPRVEEKKG